MNAEVEVTQSRRAMPQELPEGEHDKPSLEYLHLDEIVTDGGTQSRAVLNQEVISSYAQKIQSGSKFPPIDCYYDGKRYWLADGFHRVAAYQKLKTQFAWEEKITAKIHQGTRRDAVLHSVGANDNHGLQRSNADKHRAVMTLLQDAEWGQWSDREIARYCKVDHKTVGKIRATLTGEFPSDKHRLYKSKHGKIAQMHVRNIGEKSCPTDVITSTEKSSSPADKPQNSWFGQDTSTIVRAQQVDMSYVKGAVATVASGHPLSGSTVAIAELPDRDGAVVELPNGSREYISLEDLQLHSSLEVHQPYSFVPEETGHALSLDAESTSPPVVDRSLIGNPVADANFSLSQIICEISVALIACIEHLPSNLLRELAGAIETELGSRSTSD